MKEYAELFAREDPLRARAEAFAARVVDVSELLARPDVRERLAPQLKAARTPLPIAYDDPCHLCHAQGVRDEPRALLDAVPGLERVELPSAELCCGSAGIYSLLRPDDSSAILEPKLAALRTSGARTLVTANPGCHLQWAGGVQRAGLDVRVAHVVELLDEALEGAARAR